MCGAALVALAMLSGETARESDAGEHGQLPYNRPVPFTERMPFPLDEQALATASMDLAFPEADGDLAAGDLVGLERLPRRQFHLSAWYSRPWVLDTEEGRGSGEPVEVLLSKTVYPAEDLHLDMVVWMEPPEGGDFSGKLRVRLEDEAGTLLSTNTIDEISETGWFFSLGFPPALMGQSGRVVVEWDRAGDIIGSASERFEVAPAQPHIKTRGRIAVEVINQPGALLNNAPITVGVPFPKGALRDPSKVRLVDGDGREIPMQTKITGRWSRFGSIQWLLCDFSVDLEGRRLALHVEYGPDVQRSEREPILVQPRESGFPDLQAGRIEASARGLSVRGPEEAEPIFTGPALHGAFVEHENGQTFVVPADSYFAIEELGSEKAVIRNAGWYVAPESGERFCNYVTRFVFHRDSPLMRIYHTWIFTGDSNRDRIAAMGWRFPTEAQVLPDGFLTGFDTGEWRPGVHLVQFDYETFAMDGDGGEVAGRTPGVMAGHIGGSRLFFAAKDFWQNFPSELEFEDDALVFYNWPRHNRSPGTASPVPAGEAFRLRFAHEGEMLDFQMPPEYTDGDIWSVATHEGREELWEKGNPDSVNAQGVARTEEFFIYFGPAEEGLENGARIMQGFNDETLRAVVDPAWVAATGAMGLIHHQDFERYPREETLYAEIARAPGRWNERLGSYGMWIHGDFPADSLNLETGMSSPRRTFKKGHHGWPYKWTPYARSGDPGLFKLAEAGTRQMVDANFRHYASPEVQGSDEESQGQGWTGTGLFPWFRIANRSISQDVDYLWDAWRLTGFRRPLDVALLWMELAKLDTSRGYPGRISVSQLYYYLDTYQATFDPWFLIAAHETAEWHRVLWGGNDKDKLATEMVGHFWKPGNYNFYRFTGDEAQAELARDIAVSWSSPWTYAAAWQRLDVPFIEESAAAYFLTGDDYYLGRIEGFMDSANIQVFDGDEPEYLRGSNLRHGGVGTALELFTGWYIQHFPLGLHALEHAGERPEPVPQPFFQRQADYETVTVEGADYHLMRPPRIVFRKEHDQAIPVFLDTWTYREDFVFDYSVTGPDGQSALSGKWESSSIQRVDLPAELPRGQYGLDLEALDPNTGWKAPASQFVPGATRVPVTPHDVPEVVVFESTEEGTPVGSSLFETQYWFLVPEFVESFWIEFRGAGAKIWNPDGEVIWDAWRDGTDMPRATVEVSPEHAGKLWRVTRPGVQQGFTVDPQIPPYFSASRRKWFQPE